jgi:DNA-binding transcriptional ArsR family regulator
LIYYYFTREDLLRTRFAISPLFEATASLRALQDPASASIHLPWIREARERTRGLELDLLHALVPGRGYHPDFIAPPPASPLPDVAEEIERVRRTPAAQVRKELEWTYPDGLPAVVRPLAENPRRELKRLAGMIAAYWEAAIAPFWERIRAVLDDDIAYRARQLTESGAIAVFWDLHPEVQYRGGALEVERPVEADVELSGRGLLLAPSAFIWPKSGAMFDPPWQPTLLYPPRGVGQLWAPERSDPHALAGLIGARRAEILGALDREASTIDLSRRLKASPAGVSEHLQVLRRAGLVRPRRQGASVFYARTAAGDGLLTAPGPSPGSPS